MLGKLLKYEFKATGRIFIPLFGALLIVAIINRVFLSLRVAVPSIIGMTLSVILIIGIFVITLIITIQRFSKNLLGNEGYLMFTLPVSSDRLIWSKLIVAAVWSIVSLVVVLLAIFIMAMTDISLGDIKEFFRYLSEVLKVSNLNISLYTIETVVLGVIYLLSGILTLYACIALSMLVNKHRGLCAFGVYIIFNIITQIIVSISISIGDSLNVLELFRKFSAHELAHIVYVFLIVINIVAGAIYYILTRFMLNRKLNLE